MYGEKFSPSNEHVCARTVCVKRARLAQHRPSYLHAVPGIRAHWELVQGVTSCPGQIERRSHAWAAVVSTRFHSLHTMQNPPCSNSRADRKLNTTPSVSPHGKSSDWLILRRFGDLAQGSESTIGVLTWRATRIRGQFARTQW